MIILGLPPIVDESAVGLLIDGEFVSASSAARFSRIESHGGFPHHAIEYVLGQVGVRPDRVDHVVQVDGTARLGPFPVDAPQVAHGAMRGG
jgi:predicted NodU family carbamoyl transferase